MSDVKVGAIIRLEFLDHSQGSDDAVLFECFGRLTKITETAYRVHSWRYVNDVDRAADTNASENEDNFAIVKKAVTMIEVLA